MQNFSLPLQTLGLLQGRLSHGEEIQGLIQSHIRMCVYLRMQAFFVLNLACQQAVNLTYVDRMLTAH